MMNGEGSHEGSSEVASPDPLDEFLPFGAQNSNGGDDSPVFSQYSSCGESEMERYCSANSVMGTPSLASSVGTFHECLESEFGSLRSFKLEDESALDNSNSRRKFNARIEGKKLSSSCRLDFGQRIESSDGNLGVKTNSNLESGQGSTSMHELNDHSEDDLGETSSRYEHSEGEDSMFGYGTDEEKKIDLFHKRNTQQYTRQVNSQNESSLYMTSTVAFGSDDWDGYMQEAEQNASASIDELQGWKKQVVERERNASNSMPTVESEEDIESCSKNPIDLLKFDRANEWDVKGMPVTRNHDSAVDDTEDSMFGYGTDKEKKIDSFDKRNTQHNREVNGANESSLYVTSKVALGPDDWDGYMQATKQNAAASSVPDELQVWKKQGVEIERNTSNSMPSDRIQATDEMEGDIKSYSKNPIDLPKFDRANEGEVKGMPLTGNHESWVDDVADYLESCHVSNLFERVQESQTEEATLEGVFNMTNGGTQMENRYSSSLEGMAIDGGHASECIMSEKTMEFEEFDPLSRGTLNQHTSVSGEVTEDRVVEFLEDSESNALPSLSENNTKKVVKGSPVSFNHIEDHPTPIKTQNFSEVYDEIVDEMEEILLDSGKSPGSRFIIKREQSQSQLPSRDGGLTASTSGMDDAYPVMQSPPRIDGVEVVGATQRKGDVSFSERLVGVKEYTVYRIRVWSGVNHWEVERRYRDFSSLYASLKTLFADRGWILPSPWSSVEQESRKIFGNVSPDVVSTRSNLIQECLQSTINILPSSSLPSCLVLFLSPSRADPSSSPSVDKDNVFTLGKTISLVVSVLPYKSMKQVLEEQHYTCVGCHKHFSDGKTRVLEFVQTLGWGKPRLCEYTGQLFCSSCHSNDTAVLPARVLHFWDFARYSVSQLAKSYLDSIHDQPMLCVSAVNPFLFSKVPALQHVTNMRKKTREMLPYVRCPFRRSIYKGIGSRRYLLDSNDFFALKDLIDLSKGVFAALPVMVESVSKKISEHITEQCLVCCDVGVPCNARKACDDLSSLIFPFQEGEVERCGSCGSVFHKHCFKRISTCPCSAPTTKPNETLRETLASGGRMKGSFNFMAKKTDSNSTMGFISDLFSKARSGNSSGSKGNDTVILMGSLPNTST